MSDQPSEPHYLISRYQRICAAKGVFLASGGRVLDFGCGSGEMVYKFRDAGFDAVGFDILDYLNLRCTDDRRFFSILREGRPAVPDFTIDWTAFRMPYPDDHFDFVFSQEVLEHVQNHKSVLSEIARVLKPGAPSIHSFPSKYRLIEPHLLVPGGGFFKSTAYFLPWAFLGIRNEYQLTCSAWVTARQNSKYAHTGLNYLAPWKLRRLSRKWFEVSEFVPQLWEAGGPNMGRMASRAFARQMYTMTKHVIWFLARPKAA
jgi:SAM-dependent methyltransferase